MQTRACMVRHIPNYAEGCDRIRPFGVCETRGVVVLYGINERAFDVNRGLHAYTHVTSDTYGRPDVPKVLSLIADSDAEDLKSAPSGDHRD